MPGQRLAAAAPVVVVVRARDHDVDAGQLGDEPSLIASTSAAVAVPRAMSGWLVTTTVSSPASRNASIAARHARQDRRRRRARPAGTAARRARPAAFRTPSRSRKTAPGTAHQPSRSPSSSIASIDCAQRLARSAARSASRSPRMLRVSRRTTGTSPFQPRSPPVYSSSTVGAVEAGDLDRQLGDLGHGDVVAGRDVEGAERAAPAVAARGSTASRTSSTWMYDLL